MEQRTEEIVRRPLYVYDLPPDILTTLRRKDDVTSDQGHDEEGAVTLSSLSLSKHRQENENIVGSKACSLCGLTFHTIEEQRDHIRSDFHNYNLKQRLRGLPAVSEGDFGTLIADLDESLSGSDSSESDDEDRDGKGNLLSSLLKSQARVSSVPENPQDPRPQKRQRGSGKAPLIWFTTPALPSNTSLGIYRAIFTDLEQQNEVNILNTIKQKQLAPKPDVRPLKETDQGVSLPAEYTGPHMFLCMIGGGHFAAMVVSLAPKKTKSSAPGPLSREAIVLAHKTFHRYTTRRKQGGSQSANDSAKGNAHSAGAGIRRYNEAALNDEVRLLLSGWKSMIDTSELLFIRATGSTNRRTLFGPYEDQVLRQNDPRIRGFPFSTRRATQNELMRSFIELTRVKVQQVDEAMAAAAEAAAAGGSQPVTSTKSQRPAAPEVIRRSEEDEILLLHTSQIQAFIRRSKLPALLSYLKANALPADFRFYPTTSQQNHHSSTPLHLAASLNSPTLVSGLLLKAGASPLVKNGDDKPAFDLTNDRATRDAFRVARFSLGDSAFDWDTAHVPATLTPEEAAERDLQHKQEERAKEESRRKQEAERLKAEGPRVPDAAPLGKAAERGRALALGQVQKTAQERREEESKGLTPEMRMRLERKKKKKVK